MGTRALYTNPLPGTHCHELPTYAPVVDILWIGGESGFNPSPRGVVFGADIRIFIGCMEPPGMAS